MRETDLLFGGLERWALSHHRHHRQYHRHRHRHHRMKDILVYVTLQPFRFGCLLKPAGTTADPAVSLNAEREHTYYSALLTIVTPPCAN